MRKWIDLSESMFDMNTPDNDPAEVHEFGGLCFEMQPNRRPQHSSSWFVFAGDRPIAAFMIDERAYNSISLHTDVGDDFQRQGYGRTIYEFAKQWGAKQGKKLNPSSLQSAAGKAFWKKNMDLFTEEAAWHGSPHAMAIDTLRPSRGGELGPGLYFSYDHKTAAGYAHTRSEDSQPHKGVIELDLSGVNIRQITRQEWLDERSRLMDDLRARNGGEWRGEFFDAALAKMIIQYESEGVDGLYDDWNQGIVFPDQAHKVKIIGRKAI